jgi:minimal PKS acyl carrier protein
VSRVSKREFTIDDLKRILRECAGSSEGIDLDGHIMDTGFDALGYDSLALLETATRIERECEVKLGDDEVSTEETPRTLVMTVNSRLEGQDR